MGAFTSTATYTNLSTSPFCLDLNESFGDVENRSACAIYVMQYAFVECTSHCHPPCREYTYSKDSFSAKWPRKSQQIPFYNEHIKGHKYENKYEMFEQIVHLKEYGNLTEAYKLLQETTLIEDNFIKLSVYLSSLDLVTVSDHVEVSSYDLLAKIGGTLNLYSGISFILIVEFIDLFYNLLFSNQRKGERVDTKSQDVGSQ